MLPSSFMISQITAAGGSSARRARSTPPSVCPVRTSTPPRLARSGKTCPGVTKSSGPLPGCMARWMVTARSCAETPVVMPCRASIDTVKAVPSGARLWLTIMDRPSSSMRSSVRAKQMRPRPYLAMKLIAAGVALLAAMHRSPSFSRLSSSIRITILPALMSAMASSLGLICRGRLGGARNVVNMAPQL